MSEREREKEGPKKKLSTTIFLYSYPKKKSLCVYMHVSLSMCLCVQFFFYIASTYISIVPKKKSTIKIRPWRNNNIKSNNNMWKNILKINEKWIALYAGCSLHQPVKKIENIFCCSFCSSPWKSTITQNILPKKAGNNLIVF